jgi:hypothetical protein
MKSSLHSLIIFLPFVLSHLRIPSAELDPILVPESESELLYDWRFTANQFVLAPSLLRLTASFLSQMNTCGHSPYITSSRQRGWISHLQLLLAHASAFILGSESSLFVASYDSQGYCVAIRPRFHAGLTHRKHRFLYCCEGVFTAPLHSNGIYSIAACVFVSAGMCLPSCCRALDMSSDFTVPAFGRHARIS